MIGLGVGVEVLRPWPVKLLVDHVLGPQPLPADRAPVLRWRQGASGPEVSATIHAGPQGRAPDNRARRRHRGRPAVAMMPLVDQVCRTGDAPHRGAGSVAAWPARTIG